MDTPDGQIWGEAVSQPENPSQGFLYGGTASTRRATTQQEIRVISGIEWVCRELLKEVANTAVEVATSTEAAADLEEWNEGRPMRTRSAKEERFLYRMLDQLDREQEERRVKLEKKISKARKQMGVGKEQPSYICDKFEKNIFQENAHLKI